MKKIFKKSLAIMVSAAICLTALIGCLSVSAANGEAPVYTVATVEGKKGETVDVNVTGADLTEICGQDLSIIFAAGLTIGTVHDNITNDDLVCDPDGDGMQYNVIVNDDGTNTLKMVDIINFPEYTGSPELVTGKFDVTISVTIPADAAAGTEYPITIDESQFADYDEEWVLPTLKGGMITVVEDAVEPVLDENIDLSGSYANISSEINLAIVVNKTTLSSYSRYEVVVTRNTFDSSYMYVAQEDLMTEPSTSYGSNDYYLYTGIGMYEMNVPITVLIKCYDIEDNYIAYNEVAFNIVDMLKEIYYTERTKETTKAMIVDLLYLGTEAQKYFGEIGSDLVNIAYPTDGFDVVSTTEFDPSELANIESVVPEEAYPSATSTLNVNIAKNPGTYYVISGLSSLDRNSVNITTSYTNGLNNQVVSETINGADATYIGNRYYYVFNKIAFYDLDKPVTLTVTYNDGKVLTTTFAVETYILKNYENPAQGDLLICLAKFSKSARTNFIV